MKSLNLFIIAFLSLSLVASCASKKNQYAETNKVHVQQVEKAAETIKEPLPPPQPSPEVFVADAEGKRSDLDWVGTVHFDMRRPSFVIIHHTAQNSLEQTLRTFTLDHTKVSSHYVIGRDGKTVQMLNDYLRSWHAGNSRWGKVTDMNSHSIGIELDNNGSEPFSPVQINSLLRLLDTLKTNYRIPTQNFLGHADIAPTRKQDPSVHFPWKILADKGFGLWPDEVLSPPPADFNPGIALQLIGYDTRNLQAAIVAFKRHYVQTDVSPQLTDYDLRVLYNLLLKQE